MSIASQIGFWQYAADALLNGQRLVLMCVMESYGSSPGRRGFKMLVADDDHMQGSIGGGFMEHKMVELCKSLLRKGRFAPFIRRQIHQSNIPTDKSGMICSGEQTIGFFLLDASTASVISEIADRLSNGKAVAISLNSVGCHYKPFDTAAPPVTWHEAGETDWSYTEQLGLWDTVYIIGGGHVGLAVSKTMRDLGFYVCICDDRPHLNTLVQNTAAHEKIIVDYSKIDHFVPEGPRVFVVLVSFGFRTDALCIRKLIGRQYAYFGVMGSREKMKTLFEEMIEAGFDPAEIDKLHSPIGLPIHSKTPAEIAISIAAEIIQIRNAQ